MCGEAATGAEAVAAARRHRPDLCLLDVQMPEGGGIFAAKEIDRWLPATKVLLLTATPDAAGALAAACVGAAGYLAKDVNRTRLAHVVLAVAAGESSYPRGLLHLVLAAVRDARQCSAI